MNDVINSIRAGSQRFLQDIFAHDYAEKQNMMRQVTAKGFGLDPALYNRPYPGSTTTNNITYTGAKTESATATAPVQVAKGLGTLAKIALGAGLLGSGAAVPLGIMAFKKDPPAAVANDPNEYELRVRASEGK